MSIDQIFSIRESVAYQKVDDEMVLLNLTAGIYYGLDSVGTRIWELSVEESTVERIVDTMLREYDMLPEQSTQDVVRFFSELQSAGLIETRPE